MSIKVMSMVFESDGLTPTQKLVLLALADHSDEIGGSVFPSVNRLTVKTGLGERAVRKCLSELRGKPLELLIIVRESSAQRATEYLIDVQKLAEMKHPDLEKMFRRPAPGAPLDDRPLHQVHPTPAPNAGVDGGPLHQMQGTPAPGAPKSSYNHHININHHGGTREGAKAPKPPKRQRDSRLDHPVLKVYNQVVKRHVSEAWRDDVISAVGDQPAELEKWATHLKDWLGHGWNVSNVKGILEVFKKGGIQPHQAKEDPWEIALSKAREKESGGIAGGKMKASSVKLEELPELETLPDELPESADDPELAATLERRRKILEG